MAVIDDLVMLAIVFAIASIVIVSFLIALYIWALRRRRETGPREEWSMGDGPWDVP